MVKSALRSVLPARMTCLIVLSASLPFSFVAVRMLFLIAASILRGEMAFSHFFQPRSNLSPVRATLCQSLPSRLATSEESFDERWPSHVGVMAFISQRRHIHVHNYGPKFDEAILPSDDVGHSL